MKKLLLTSFCVGLLVGGTISTVSAAPKDTNTPAAAASATKAKHAPFRGTVEAVDTSAKTITLKGAKHQVIGITDQTKITKDGQPATMKDITVGTLVTGSKKETTAGTWEAGSLKIGGAAKPAADKATKTE